MRLLFAFARLAVVLILLPAAVDWRSPALSAIRPWAMFALVAAPLAIAALEIRLWRRWRVDAGLVQALHGSPAQSWCWPARLPSKRVSNGCATRSCTPTRSACKSSDAM
jgi:hypothetical protein